MSYWFRCTGEDNVTLRNGMIDVCEQPIVKANSQMQSCLKLQGRTRASLHETPRYLHQLSVALVGLQDRIPSICNRTIAPVEI